MLSHSSTASHTFFLLSIIIVLASFADDVVKIHFTHSEILLKWIPSLSDECLYETQG